MDWIQLDLTLFSLFIFLQSLRPIRNENRGLCEIQQPFPLRGAKN